MNPHGLRHTPLKRACLPIPPLRLCTIRGHPVRDNNDFRGHERTPARDAKDTLIGRCAAIRFRGLSAPRVATQRMWNFDF